MGGGNWLLQGVLWSPHKCPHVYTHIHKQMNVINYLNGCEYVLRVLEQYECISHDDSGREGLDKHWWLWKLGDREQPRLNHSLPTTITTSPHGGAACFTKTGKPTAQLPRTCRVVGTPAIPTHRKHTALPGIVSKTLDCRVLWSTHLTRVRGRGFKDCSLEGDGSRSLETLALNLTSLIEDMCCSRLLLWGTQSSASRRMMYLS